jgi:hypothetical protein
MSEATAIARPETVTRAIRRITGPARTLQEGAQRLHATYVAKVERASTEYVDGMRQLLEIAFGEELEADKPEETAPAPVAVA